MRSRSVFVPALLLSLICGCLRPGGPTTRPAAAADPALAEELYARGLAVQKQGRKDEAIRLYYQAIRADPNHAPVLNHLAWLRATDPEARYRRGAEAVRLAERACELVVAPARPSVFAANCLDTLAAAYARAGRFADAVKAARRAIAMAEALGRRGAARSFAARLELFKRGQPYQEK